MDELDQSIVPDSQPTATTSKSLIIMLLLIFPPIAFYFMWKEKRYHLWFAYLLIFVGGITSGLETLLILFVKPTLVEMYKEFNIEFSTSFYYIVSYFLLIVGVIELALGFFLINKMKTDVNQKKLLAIAVFLLLINLLFGGYLQSQSVSSMIMPLYKIASESNVSPSLSAPTNIPQPANIQETSSLQITSTSGINGGHLWVNILGVKTYSTHKSLIIDYLENNPCWTPGGPPTADCPNNHLYLNKVAEMIEIPIAANAKAFNCTSDADGNDDIGPDNDPTSADTEVPVDYFVGKLNSIQELPVDYFIDTDNDKITAIYERCLP